MFNDGFFCVCFWSCVCSGRPLKVLQHLPQTQKASLITTAQKEELGISKTKLKITIFWVNLYFCKTVKCDNMLSWNRIVEVVAEEHVDLSHAVVKTSFAVLCDKSGRRRCVGAGNHTSRRRQQSRVKIYERMLFLSKRWLKGKFLFWGAAMEENDYFWCWLCSVKGAGTAHLILLEPFVIQDCLILLEPCVKENCFKNYFRLPVLCFVMTIRVCVTTAAPTLKCIENHFYSTKQGTTWINLKW